MIKATPGVSARRSGASFSVRSLVIANGAWRMNKPAIIDDIDFGRMYRDHMARAGAKPKPATTWDARAEAMDARERADDGYFEALIARLNLSGCSSLLDVGCGNGALAVALAPRFVQVLALDYSPAMIEIAQLRADGASARNVKPVLRAWEDDWSDLPICDMAIASRSTAVMDLEAALCKLDAFARKRVALTAFVGGRAIHRDLLRALGRPPTPEIFGPDYIYAVNLLHRMGRLPKVDFIPRERAEDARTDWDGFRRNVEFALGRLSEPEVEYLRDWWRVNPTAPLFEREQTHWAFISWETGVNR